VATPGLDVREDYFRMQNVATRRRDRINSDEEERFRIGYELRTTYRFATREGQLLGRRPTLSTCDADGHAGRDRCGTGTRRRCGG
jgi:hypothetical protein